MDETVTLDETGPPTDQQVLQAALDASDTGGSFTLSYNTTSITLDDDYSVSGRQVKRVFRDMVDRAGRVWWIDPGGSTINVGLPGGRGTWKTLDAQADSFGVVSFDEGSVESVRNDVTVIGTGDVAVEGTASDSGSISSYGSRPGDSPYQVSYITSQSEATAVASSLLVPDPLASGEIVVGQNIGDVTQPLANYQVDVADQSKGIDETGLTVTKQTVEQGRATLMVGEGAGDSVERVNRRVKSNGDLTEPGSVYDSERIADRAILESKLEDAAVATAKIQDNAVVNGSLADLSVSETKIQDGSISTPKLTAGAVTANEIEADTITAAQIAAGTITALEIQSDTITAAEIAAGTLTANEVDAFDLDTTQFEISVSGEAGYLDFVSSAIGPDGAVQFVPKNGLYLQIGTSTSPTEEVQANLLYAQNRAELRQANPINGDNSGSVGTASDAWADVYAHNYVTASPDVIDGVSGDELRTADWYTNPPEPVRKRARDIGDTDDEIPEGMGHTPVELGTMANWLLEACKSQQERIDNLEARLSALEDTPNA